MADQYVKLLEAVEREERITTNGSEIVITWYVEPYTAAPVVSCALLGRVTGNTVNDTRVLPASDHDMPFFYCVEARRKSIDRRVVAFSPSIVNLAGGAFGDEMETIRLALAQPIIMDGPQAMGAASKKDIKASASYAQPDSPRGQAGAFIEAIYRPLPTVFRFSSDPTEDERIRSFDYIDPQYHPCSRTVSTGGGLRVIPQFKAAGTGIGIDAGGDGLLTDSWIEFSIRRLMCPTVPWHAIQQLQNSVNKDSQWAVTAFDVDGLPNNTFFPGVLRFNAPDIVKRTVPTCMSKDGSYILTKDGIPTTRSMTWYDISYNFSWRTTLAHRYDLAGRLSNGRVFIGWNDTWYGGGLSQIGVGAVNLSAGWYETGYFQVSSANLLVQAGAFLPRYEDTAWADVSFIGMNHPFEALFNLTTP